MLDRHRAHQPAKPGASNPSALSGLVRALLCPLPQRRPAAERQADMATTATRRRSTVEQAGNQAEQAVRRAARNPWVERLARFGLAARGLVYAVVGLLAVQTAFFGRGATTDTRGAIQKIAEQSRPLLALVAIGLVGYALWRFSQALLDPENKGRDAKGLLKRGAMLGSGIIYSGLAWAAFRILTGQGSAGSAGGGNERITATVLDKPFGRWLVALAGLAVIAGGLQQLHRAWKRSFEEKLNLGQMDATERRLALRTGQLGLAARGIVFLLTGSFLVRAAWTYDASEARGLRGALDTLASQPHGPWLLGAVALGLVAFGAYSFLEARYRRIVF